MTLEPSGVARLMRGDAQCDSVVNLADDAWHHVAIVVETANSARTALHIDGQLVCRLDDPQLDDAAHLGQALYLGGSVEGCPAAGEPYTPRPTIAGNLGRSACQPEPATMGPSCRQRR